MARPGLPPFPAARGEQGGADGDGGPAPGPEKEEKISSVRKEGNFVMVQMDEMKPRWPATAMQSHQEARQEATTWKTNRKKTS